MPRSYLKLRRRDHETCSRHNSQFLSFTINDGLRFYPPSLPSSVKLSKCQHLSVSGEPGNAKNFLIVPNITRQHSCKVSCLGANSTSTGIKDSSPPSHPRHTPALPAPAARAAPPSPRDQERVRGSNASTAQRPLPCTCCAHCLLAAEKIILWREHGLQVTSGECLEN